MCIRDSVLGGGRLFAAGAKEQQAYAAAVAAFQDEMWSRAETAFDQFVKKYPESTNAPEAVLLQAQAEFKHCLLYTSLPHILSTFLTVPHSGTFDCSIRLSNCNFYG